MDSFEIYGLKVDLKHPKEKTQNLVTDFPMWMSPSANRDLQSKHIDSNLILIKNKGDPSHFDGCPFLSS